MSFHVVVREERPAGTTTSRLKRGASQVPAGTKWGFRETTEGP